jgi:MFS family permease
MRLKVLLAGILAFHAGWYMLVPFFAILFTSRRGFSPAEVGVLMATQSFLLLFGSLVGGVLADRLGRRWTMVVGLVLRAGGVALLGLAVSLPAALGAAAIAGVGGGFYGPAAKAAIAVLATGTEQTRAFALRGIAANIGTSSGPLVGSLLMRGPMPVLFGAAGAVHAVLAVATWALLPAEAGTLDRQERAPWRETLADMPYMAFTVVAALSWALFTQLNIAVPLYASRVLGLEASIGLLWTISSLVVIALQVPVTKVVAARVRPATAMALGVALLGAGLGLVGLARSFAGLVGAVLVFVAGEMLLLPTVDTTVSTMAAAGAVGSYFGLASFAWGLGEGVGNLTGGALMQYALGRGPRALPWVSYAAAGLAVAGLYRAFGARAKARLEPAEAVSPGTPASPAAPAAKPAIRVYRPGQPAPEEEALTLGRGSRPGGPDPGE